jgi:hypothetical protein
MVKDDQLGMHAEEVASWPRAATVRAATRTDVSDE